ncbi:MAG: GNAT family N-acetyltransferase [Candidatus Thermoplasmatota archaeon]|nr:GNAT family N-acetyltransferase [Candidatus Thermoplasmatota archaeon]
MAQSSSEPGQKDDVIVISCEQGTLSVEIMSLRDGVARAFLRASPRTLVLPDQAAQKLHRLLMVRPYSRILVQDNRRGLIKNTLSRQGWSISRAIRPKLPLQCSMMTPYDLPMDDSLFEPTGAAVDLRNTDQMHGIEIDLGPRKVWAFYTDDGDTARIIYEGERRLGMMVASNPEDFEIAGGCLLHFLSMAGKSWAVFSADMGRFIRKYDPITMWRMALERPRAFQHSAKPLSKQNKAEAVRLFSEYYDETKLQAMLRVRRLRSDPRYSMFLVDGGFVINRTDGETGLIYDIYVTPGKQGEGLGSELMKAALSNLAGKVNSSYLHTSYPRAKRLYEKFGFKVVHSQLGIRLDEIVLEPPSASSAE